MNACKYAEGINVGAEAAQEVVSQTSLLSVIEPVAVLEVFLRFVRELNRKHTQVLPKSSSCCLAWLQGVTRPAATSAKPRSMPAW